MRRARDGMVVEGERNLLDSAWHLIVTTDRLLGAAETDASMRAAVEERIGRAIAALEGVVPEGFRPPAPANRLLRYNGRTYVEVARR